MLCLYISVYRQLSFSVFDYEKPETCLKFLPLTKNLVNTNRKPFYTQFSEQVENLLNLPGLFILLVFISQKGT